MGLFHFSRDILVKKIKKNNVAWRKISKWPLHLKFYQIYLKKNLFIEEESSGTSKEMKTQNGGFIQNG
jgi:hypothetical protein